MARGQRVTALVILTALAVATEGWVNTFDHNADFHCPEGQFLSHVTSEHQNHYEDRVWNFACSAVPAEGKVTNCYTTNYVNEWDKPFTYQCPGEGFITGMDSVHANHYEDRRFKFHCCSVPGYVAHNCYFTNWANEMDHLLDYQVPAGKILRGVASYHENHYEDRRFKFEICNFDALGR